jgi:hypothetical protein
MRKNILGRPLQFLKFTNTTCRIDNLWYNNRKAFIIFYFKSFFSPLARQPKNMTDYTIAASHLWYNNRKAFIILISSRFSRRWRGNRKT